MCNVHWALKPSIYSYLQGKCNCKWMCGAHALCLQQQQQLLTCVRCVSCEPSSLPPSPFPLLYTTWCCRRWQRLSLSVSWSGNAWNWCWLGALSVKWCKLLGGVTPFLPSRPSPFPLQCSMWKWYLQCCSNGAGRGRERSGGLDNCFCRLL